MFYEFTQNNTGGDFIIDESSGISINVIVEADSAEDANYRAEQIGIYFDGCRDGRDCSCCGDRWYRQWSSDTGEEVPSHYSTPLIDYPVENRIGSILWAGDQADTYVHVKDGRFFGFVLTESGHYVYDGKAGDIPAELSSAQTKAIG